MEIYNKKEFVIGLCDDEKYVHEIIEKLLLKYENMNEVECRLIYFESAKVLLNADIQLDVLLLDIEMPDMDGIEAAFKLRDRGIEYKIIMLTAREDRYREAFKIGAFRFVPKPIREDELFETLNEVQEHLAGMSEVKLYRDRVLYQIIQRDILYVEANHAETLIFTKNSEYRSEQSLMEWKNILDERLFFQCHKSYIVNMGKIEEIQQNIILLVTGDKIQVSRRLKKPLLQAFMEFDTKRR